MTKVEIFSRIALGEMPQTEWFEGWEYEDLRGIADHHRVLTIVAKCFPSDKVAIGDIQQILIRELQIKNLTQQITLELEREGIPSHVFKGPSLNDMISDPFPRESRDIDILVRKSDLLKAYKVISEKRKPIIPVNELRINDRIEPVKDLIIVSLNPRIRIELHWRFVYSYFDQSALESLWEFKEVDPSKVIHAEYEALVTHAFQHGFSRIRWVRDLQLLRKRFGLNYSDSPGGMHEREFVLALTNSSSNRIVQELYTQFVQGIESGNPSVVGSRMQHKIRWVLCNSVSSKLKMILVHLRKKVSIVFMSPSKLMEEEI